jgi:hypothetical protein
VIYVTGGAWLIGYKAWGALIGRRLSQRGALVFCLDYRNFPQGRALDMLEDVNAGARAAARGRLGASTRLCIDSTYRLDWRTGVHRSAPPHRAPPARPDLAPQASRGRWRTPSAMAATRAECTWSASPRAAT